MAIDMDSTEYQFTEKQVTTMLDRAPSNKIFHRWISIGGDKCGVKLNWVTSILAVALTWGFAFTCLADENANKYFGSGKSWVSQNFTWLYIGTQDVWCLFLIYLCFSRFANIKLGKDDEKPRYSDFTWFAMLFTCGVAVGLYVFGVAEPLYFYRQPTLWHSWGYDYAHTKVSVESDSLRAQQAIFMAVYHWGIHGWVPYILLALLAGITSFRWNMPMTIRSCFYPLLGDHALGFFGDFIDALSISTTTFGVCTSLGLGVTQLSAGLQFLKNINCKVIEKCQESGGVWDISKYGTNNCFDSAGAAVKHDSCVASWLETAQGKQDSYYLIIALITIFATCSVLTGIDRGIQVLAKMAFSCGMIVMLVVFFADNTWYLLNVMVQTTGFYLQYVIQVGFDCEAFQQLAFEFKSGDDNKLWGSTGSESALGKLAAVGIDLVTSSSDCGDQPNPCTMGMISAVLGAAIFNAHNVSTATAAAITAGATHSAELQAMRMSPHSIETLGTAAGLMPGLPIPCGSGWNTTHYDKFTYEVTGVNPSGVNMYGDSLPVDFPTDFPRCPETVTKDVSSWGQCKSFKLNCPTTATYFNDSNPKFMDWWTIFYWAWWITWAPFVGFFVALISRGRTVREVIIGGFICPTLFAIIWFSVFGGLAIKMERTAELALQVRPDGAHASITCAEHYTGGGVPITPDSKKLAQAGYYMITCMPKDDQIYRVMEPYANLQGFLHFFLWIGLVIYFLTSSDSGSMTDDIMSSSGLSSGYIPYWQKIFWCFTEGLVAIALVHQAGALNSLQALSIIIGLPYTFFLCMMVPALYRVLKHVAGDEDILNSKRFNTQLLDWTEGFKPHGGSPCSPLTHIKWIVMSLFFPCVAVQTCMLHLKPDEKITASLYAVAAQLLHLAWIILAIVEVDTEHLYILGWLAFVFMTCITFSVRMEMRLKYNVWGSYVDDFWCALAFPFSYAQCAMMAETDGKDAPGYFDSANELIAQMADASGKDVIPVKAVAVNAVEIISTSATEKA